MRTAEEIINHLLISLPELRTNHSPGNPVYQLLSSIAKTSVTDLFGPDSSQRAHFGPFGMLEFPYTSMGAISSLELFGLDELIIFSFYWRNRAQYRKVLDLGANIGLHSCLLARCGYSVTAYEPDPGHYKKLTNNLANNACSNVQTVPAAVSTHDGEMEFVRVLGNTTGSHLAGAKANPYGELERFQVRVEDFGKMIRHADLIKMDVEGLEQELLLSTHRADWAGTDAMVEIGSKANAEAVFAHFQTEGINLFAQKTGWQRIEELDDMPSSYRDGSVFISLAAEMPW
jgi:FkbM family methyltransferase